MKFDSIVPILYSADVSKSIAYYTEQLGFVDNWEWDKPATFGGVSRDDVNIFFCKEGQGSPGTWLCINVDNVDEYYETIKNGEAMIVSVPENKEWNMREMLVRDPDGHIIRFGHRTDCD